jgi:ATP citrate (pro-S)-lyase
MPYNILSEYLCKIFYSNINNIPKNIIKIDNKLDLVKYKNIFKENDRLVCKVDQEIKHRKLLNLVELNKNYKECNKIINKWIDGGQYNKFIIEKMMDIKKEYYLMIQFNEYCDELYFSYEGGINFNDLNKCICLKLDPLKKIDEIDFSYLNLENNIIETIKRLYTFYREYNIVFMEVNPLVLLNNNTVVPLDFAVKYDTTSTYLLTNDDRELIYENELNNKFNHNIEKEINDLDSQTGSSLKFTLLNPNGNIWTLIAGGGASVLYTDSIINMGLKDKLANYGEYSGNPSASYVYLYSKKILKLMLDSSSKEQIILIVGGGISNFTYVDKTFEGILKSIEELSSEICSKNIKILVRRGGLNYQQGLNNFKKLCNKLEIECKIHGPETHITNFLKNELKHNKLIEETSYESIPKKIVDKIDNSLKNILVKKIYNKNSKIVIMNFQVQVVQRILDYDYICEKKNPSVVGIIFPNRAGGYFPVFWGNKEILLPIFKSLDDALIFDKKIDTVINYNSFRSSFSSSMNVINNNNIKFLAIIAEGMCEKETRILNMLSKKKNITILGPSTVGSIMINELRIGNTCGSIKNINSLNLCNQGSVSIVTRSGGLLNEMCNIISNNTDGIIEAVSIGGDRYPCSTFIDHILRFEKDDRVKLICLLGEIGNIYELEVARAYRNGILKKPIIAWVMGISAKYFSNNIQFGHAGSSANNFYETAQFKNNYLKESGICVPESFEDIETIIIEKAHELNILKKGNKNNNINIPSDFNELYKNNKIRKKSNFFSSISNEKGNELTYNHEKITNIITQPNSVGVTLGHLLFKKKLPSYLTKFLEMTITMLADHGIAVSSAHNTAVCGRSGQNISSSVASGLLCISDKHGGALQNSAELFYDSYYIKKLDPLILVKNMKKENKYIPGIGHAYKNSTTNKDKRIDILLTYIKKNFINYELVNYAKKVESITLKKKENLILNVDGLIACSIISAYYFHYGKKETEELLKLKGLNSIFIISRTIGLCGTYMDQNRLKQGLYRHDHDSITYL